MTETETLFQQSPLKWEDFSEFFRYQQQGFTTEEWMKKREEKFNDAQAKAKADEKSSNTPTTYDLINGGIRQFLHRRAVQAPQVDVERHVFIQRQISEAKHDTLVRKMEEGTSDSYNKMDHVRVKLVEHGYKPQARMNFNAQGANAFDFPYSGEHKTAGKPTNQPDAFTTFQDRSINVNRGRLDEHIPVGTKPYVDFM
jgi:hypothetical protein